MITLDALAQRLGWQEKDRMRRVRRLLMKMEASTGAKLLIDLGDDARPRYWADEAALGHAFPSLVEDVRETDERVAALHEEVESLRELLLNVTNRVGKLEMNRR